MNVIHIWLWLCDDIFKWHANECDDWWWMIDCDVALGIHGDTGYGWCRVAGGAGGATDFWPFFLMRYVVGGMSWIHEVFYNRQWVFL
ncbi:hypothetical protein [Serratia marcescens]